MSFTGQWRCSLTRPIPGGADDTTDTLDIAASLTVGTVFSMSRHEEVHFNPGDGRQCQFVADSIFDLTVKELNPTSMRCSVAHVNCAISENACDIRCPGPGAIPDVTFTIATNTLIGSGFVNPSTETFVRVSAEHFNFSDAARSRPRAIFFHSWNAALVAEEPAPIKYGQAESTKLKSGE